MALSGMQTREIQTHNKSDQIVPLSRTHKASRDSPELTTLQTREVLPYK